MKISKVLNVKQTFGDYSYSKKILGQLKLKTTKVSNQDLRNLAECDK